MKRGPKFKPPAHSVQPVVRELFTIMNEKNITLQELENRSGYRRETFMKWRTGTHGATVFALEAALNALGYELKVVKKEKENADS